MPAAPPFEKVRETSWRVLALIVVIDLSYISVSAVVQSQKPVLEALRNLTNATGGFVIGTLVFGSVYLSVMALAIFAIGRQRPSDVGWHAQAIWPALLVTALCWIVMQGILAVIATIGDGQLAWHDSWRQAERYPGVVVGAIVGRLPGNILVEETLYRGFVLAQVYLKAARKSRRGIALIIAVLGSSIIFSLGHIPGDLLSHGFDASRLIDGQFDRLINGILFASLYLVTRNLFVSMGMHLLFNLPMPLMQVPDGAPRSVCSALMLILLVAWALAREFWPWRTTSITKETTNPTR